MENVQHAAHLREWHPGDEQVDQQVDQQMDQQDGSGKDGDGVATVGQLPRQRGVDPHEHTGHEHTGHEHLTTGHGEQGVAPCADEVAHAERLHGLVRRVLDTGARTVRDPRALAVLVGVTDADRVYVASALAVQ
ncbi:MAG TPA: hypothetical protein VFS29_10080 [Motilibacteraceae bacterium]|nr:hypothetical protein [Motilibacteraceae bacterium]